ncbi:MAG: hypothetical protein D4R43_03960 [Sphingobacteriales bacterium]|nr:MAG: hypothetical protein D4R43_03960 [Sphingobacteriales bacterium]
MANKIFTLLLFLFVFIACNQNKKESVTAEQTKSDSLKTCSINPNGQSELAELMRQMQGYFNSMRGVAITQNINSDMPDFFNKLHTAKPTDSTMVDSEFDSRTDDYLKTVKALYHHYPESQPMAFNAVIAKCQSCHEHYCPGPLSAIKKMYIPK